MSKLHSALGASSASRWMACPGSYRVANAVKEPARPSVWATQGTVAHAIAEEILNNGGPIDRQLGQTIVTDGYGIDIDQDMIDSVETYINAVDPIIADADFWNTEQTVTLNDYWPQGKTPVDLFGTCDLLAYSRARRRLTIADYKHGAGVYVGHVDNAQTLYYAAGALSLLQVSHPNEAPLEVEMIIAQPRVPGHEPIRSQILPVIDILLWVATKLKPAVEQTQQPDAELVTGDHCRWCPGRVICPAMLAVRDRSLLPFDPIIEDATDAEIAAFLDDAEKLDIWVGAVRQEAQQRIEGNGHVPGWGLVPTRPRRVWSDDEDVAQLLDQHGVQTGDAGKYTLYSPAQMEKHISVVAWRAVQRFIDVKSSGLKLARMTPANPFDPVATEETQHG